MQESQNTSGLKAKSFSGAGCCDMAPQTTNLTFRDALDWMKAGRHVTRVRGFEVILIPMAQCYYLLSSGQVQGIGLTNLFVIKSSHDNSHRPIELSADDLLAKDWEVVS